MTTTSTRAHSPSLLLIAPHQFPDLLREKDLAETFGLELAVAKDQDDFESKLPLARLVMVTPYGKVLQPQVETLCECAGIVRYGIGYDNIDAAAATVAGVPVSIVPDASTEEVASHAFALGLALLRRVPAGGSAIAGGQWAGAVPADLPVLSQTRVGVVGMGRIGRKVAHWWKAVGATVVAFDPVASFTEVNAVELDKIIETCDVVSLHVPLNDETHHMIDANTIEAMARGTVVVNVSRGGLIDEPALAAGLTSGHLGGAGLDVFETEPLPADSPLRKAPNLIITPHAAWKSRSSLAALQEGAVERAADLLNGRTPRNVVTR